MINLTNCPEILNNYKGSEKKKTLIYDNKKYLVKFPDPIREKNKGISYINNAFSEYIGSNIFEILGFNTQKTILGIYNYQGNDKIVCACEDFTNENNILYDFENLSLSSNPDKKIDTEIKDIIEVLEANKNLIPFEATKDMFWNIFVVDTLLGNTDRHNGNWGFILNKNSGDITFAPIYDNGSCLNPLLSDIEIEHLDKAEIKNIAMNTYSCLKNNGKKINSIEYIKNSNNINLREAFKRVFPLIKNNIDNIYKFVNGIECLKSSRRNFYIAVLKERYNILNQLYKNLIETDN